MIQVGFVDIQYPDCGPFHINLMVQILEYNAADVSLV